jgi:hypothetical protein
LVNIASDVDSLHVEIDNLNDLLVGFCFIRSIDWNYFKEGEGEIVGSKKLWQRKKNGYMKAWYVCNYSRGITLWLIEA